MSLMSLDRFAIRLKKRHIKKKHDIIFFYIYAN